MAAPDAAVLCGGSKSVTSECVGACQRQVQAFVRGALVDALSRAGERYVGPKDAATDVVVAPEPMEEADLTAFLVAQRIDQVVCAYAPNRSCSATIRAIGRSACGQRYRAGFVCATTTGWFGPMRPKVSSS